MDETVGAEHIQAILSSAGLTLRSVRRPGSGLTGSVFILETSQGGLILKVSHDPACDWKFRKERIVYGLLREQGLPAPHVLVTDLSRGLAPFAYSLSEHLPGLTLSQAYESMSAAERLDTYRQLGDLLGRMHSLTFDRFGDVMEWDGVVTVGPAWELVGEADGGDVGPFTIWREMHQEIVRGRLAFLSRTEFLDLTTPIGRWFGDHEGLLDHPIVPRLLHMDLHMSNVLVSEGRITGVLDVEEAIIGHNEYDLMRTELAHFGDGEEALREAFFSGYAAHVTLDAGYEGRRPFYELSRSLVGLQCLVRYGDTVGEADRTRASIQELLEAPSPSLL